MKRDLKGFVKSRDQAITNAVLYDDWAGVKRHMKKYGQVWPKNEKVFKASIYKAAQYCTGLSDEVRDKAFTKALELGFSPLIREYEEESND